MDFIGYLSMILLSMRVGGRREYQGSLGQGEQEKTVAKRVRGASLQADFLHYRFTPATRQQGSRLRGQAN